MNQKFIIDTNIIFSDFQLQKAKLVGLCQSVRTSGNKILIPDVVIEEAINQYRENISAKLQSIERTATDLRRLTGQNIVKILYAQDAVEKEIERYRKYFYNRLHELGITRIQFPNISHQDLVKRDLERRRPFQPSGKGYRDALIWESVLSVCERDDSLFPSPEIVFINKNVKDFCENGELHPDLQQDLLNSGFDINHVKIVADIDTAVTNFIRPGLEIADELTSKLNANSNCTEIDFKEEITHRVEKFLQDKQFDFEDSPLRQEFENPIITSVYEPSYRFIDIRHISDNELQIELNIEVNCDFDFFICKSDLGLLEYEEMPYITDEDWNNHYVAASDSHVLSLSMSLITDTTLSEIISEEISICE